MRKIIVLTILFFATQVVTAQETPILIPYNDNGKWGYCDVLRKVYVQPAYDSAGLMEQLYVNARVMYVARVIKDKKIGVINHEGTEILKPIYDKIQFGIGDLQIIFTLNNKQGVFDIKKQKIIVSNTYQSIREIIRNHYLLVQNGKVGIANENGDLVIPVDFTQINYLNYTKNGTLLWRVINDNETKIIETNALKDENEGAEIYTKAEDAGMYGLMDAKLVQKKVDSLLKIYDYVDNYNGASNGYVVTKKGKQGFVNLISNKTLAPKYEGLQKITEHTLHGEARYILQFREANQYGLVFDNGNQIIPAVCSQIKFNSGPVIQLIQGDNYGFYFIKNNQHILPKYALYNNSYPVLIPSSNFYIVPVQYPITKQWFYIGENGLEFRNIEK